MRRALAAVLAAVVLATAACGGTTSPDDAADPVLEEVPVDAEQQALSVPAEVPGPGEGQVVAEAAAPPPPPAAEPPSESGPTTADPPGFVFSVASVTAADLPSSWRAGCPVGPEDLRAVTLSYVDFDGVDRTGVLVVNASIVTPVRRAFGRLYALRFPISSIRPVDEFGGSDDASMAANNTSAFNCRYAVSDSATPSWSNHAYGRAIDVNTVQNPYVLNGRVLPPEGAPYVDRDGDPGMFVRGSEALAAFTDNGFEWGGTWRNPDYQHMER